MGKEEMHGKGSVTLGKPRGVHEKRECERKSVLRCGILVLL